MSYGRICYITYKEIKNLDQQIVDYFHSYGVNVRMHPETKHFEDTGFLPAVFFKDSPLFSEKVHHDLLTGAEIYLWELTDEEREEVARENATHGLLAKLFKLKSQKSYTHSISAGTLLEGLNSNFENLFSILYISALVHIFDGKFVDPQEGVFLTKNNLGKYLQNYLRYFENDLDAILKNSNFVKFEGWIGE